MKNFDVVYILKNDIDSEEIKYSIRSLCENFPFRKLIFIGGCPKGFAPDLYIPHLQEGNSKWERSRSSLLKILQDENVTEDFFLFNDDFYVLKPIKEPFINFVDGTLEHRVYELQRKRGINSSYSMHLSRTATKLKSIDKDTLNFAVHMPLLINRYKALEILNSYPKEMMFRSIYGNCAEVPYVSHKDVKIYDLDSLPIFDDYLSTSDDSFKNGAVGVWVRNRFSTPCKYEQEIYPIENFNDEEEYSYEKFDL